MREQLASELEGLVSRAEDDLRRLSEAEVSEPRSRGGWSKRQILGHLIDSTAANHQRFVRAQFTDELRFPSYDAPAWVDVQRYDTEDWTALVDLLTSYARHLAHIVAVLPESSFDTPCWVDWFGEPKAIPLREVVEAYIEHVRGHLRRIIESQST